MSDIVIADLKRAKRKNGKSSVREKRMRTSSGKVERILSLDANSATFIDDLTIVFEKNVRRARDENRRLLGSPDGVMASSKK